MGRDWYRVEHKTTDISRSYDFSDWLYKHFSNDSDGISINLQEFEEELKKEITFLKTFKDEIVEWREELKKYDEDEYVDYVEV